MTQIPEYEGLIVFGDSWSDTGIVQGLFLQSFGFPIYNPDITSSGRFTTGLNFIDLLSGHLDFTPEQVTNFAVGGAQLLTDRTWNDMTGGLLSPDDPNRDFRVDVVGQIDQFLAGLSPDADLSGMAASLLIGGNDILQSGIVDGTEAEIIAQATALGQDMVDALLAQAVRLADAGVGTLLLYTSPGPQVLPRSLTQPDALVLAGTVTGEILNDGLRDGIAQLEAMGLQVELIEQGALMEEVAADFASFGFQTYNDPVTLDNATINPAVAGIPFDQIPMLDGIHKTEAFDRIIAQFEFESLTSAVTIGGAQRDVIMGDQGDSLRDMVLARDGDDLVLAGDGADVVMGGLGHDRLLGGQGADLLGGGSGDDRLGGGAGRDILADHAGDDRVAGGAGRDVLIDGAGSDVHLGGGGADVFVYTDQALLGGDSSGDQNRFLGGAGADTLILRLSDTEAQAFNEGALSLADLGITARGIETVVAVAGLEVPDLIDGTPLVDQADSWGFL